MILNHKIILSYLAFFAGIGFGVAGLVIPPAGQLAGSVLILIGQLLVLSGTFVGLDVKFDLERKYFHAKYVELTGKKDAEEIEQLVKKQYGEIQDNDENEDIEENIDG